MVAFFLYKVLLHHLLFYNIIRLNDCITIYLCTFISTRLPLPEKKQNNIPWGQPSCLIIFSSFAQCLIHSRYSANIITEWFRHTHRITRIYSNLSFKPFTKRPQRLIKCRDVDHPAIPKRNTLVYNIDDAVPTGLR